MALKPLAPRAIPDFQANAAFADVRDEWNAALLGGLFHSGVLLEDLALSPIPREVFHGLGRVPKIVLGVKVDTSAVISVDAVTHSDPRRFINLVASDAVIANVLIA